MKCYNHPDTDAVAQCHLCSKGLCRPCAEQYTPLTCSTCAEQLLVEDQARAEQSMAEDKARVAEDIASMKKEVSSIIFKQILCGLFLIWAISFMITGLVNGYETHETSESSFNWWVSLFTYFGWGGLPCLLYAIATGAWKEPINQNEIKVTIHHINRNEGIDDIATGCLGTAIGYILGIVVVFLLAGVVTPLIVLFTIWLFFSLSKRKIFLKRIIQKASLA